MSNPKIKTGKNRPKTGPLAYGKTSYENGWEVGYKWAEDYLKKYNSSTSINDKINMARRTNSFGPYYEGANKAVMDWEDSIGARKFDRSNRKDIRRKYND